MSLISIKSFESAESDLAETSQEVFAMQKNDMLKAGERYCMIEELEKRWEAVKHQQQSYNWEHSERIIQCVFCNKYDTLLYVGSS